MTDEGRDHEERRIGVISDTHGLLRPEALEALADCDLILHAGDVGRREVIERLEGIAPVIAVRGNMDRDGWALELPDLEMVKIGAITACVIHDLQTLDLEPGAAGVDVVISGHSHRPGISEKEGVLYLNPGAAGRRRFDLPVTVALLRVRGKRLMPRIVPLTGDDPT